MMMAVMAMLKLMWCRALSGSWRMVRRQTAGRDANQRAFAEKHEGECQPPDGHVHGFWAVVSEGGRRRCAKAHPMFFCCLHTG